MIFSKEKEFVQIVQNISEYRKQGDILAGRKPEFVVKGAVLWKEHCGSL